MDVLADKALPVLVLVLVLVLVEGVGVGATSAVFGCGGVGIRSGATFADAVAHATGATPAVAALVGSIMTALAGAALVRLVRSDPLAAAGQLSGLQTQPAVLAFAAERSGGDERRVRRRARLPGRHRRRADPRPTSCCRSRRETRQSPASQTPNGAVRSAVRRRRR